ncbi:MAG: hypothetical protein HOP29_14785 [Phycisphaerales bacterium]|nr:hypothetical protein [Phycisphaerales bacterium]
MSTWWISGRCKRCFRPVDADWGHPPVINNDTPVSIIRVGLADANTGVDVGTLSIRGDFAVAGRAPGEELSDLALQFGDGIYIVPLGGPLPLTQNAHVFVQAAELQGNISRVHQRFSIVAIPGDFDADGDIDLVDFSVYVDCVTGPAPPAPPTQACSAADLDNDGDVDLINFAMWQRAI